MQQFETGVFFRIPRMSKLWEKEGLCRRPIIKLCNVFFGRPCTSNGLRRTVLRHSAPGKGGPAKYINLKDFSLFLSESIYLPTHHRPFYLYFYISFNHFHKKNVTFSIAEYHIKFKSMMVMRCDSFERIKIEILIYMHIKNIDY